MQKNPTPEEVKNQQIRDRQQSVFERRFVGSSLSEIRSPEWVQVKINQFLKKKSGFLIYCSNPGTGKTYTCSALTEWAMDNFGSSWRYWKEGEIYQKLRSLMDSSSGDYMDNLKYLIDDDLLIIDDLGSAKKLNDWREEVLFSIIDYRYNSQKPTIITSNFFEKEFFDNYHSRIHSRLFSDENIVIQWKQSVDFRLEQKTNAEYKHEIPLF